MEVHLSFRPRPFLCPGKQARLQLRRELLQAVHPAAAQAAQLLLPAGVQGIPHPCHIEARLPRRSAVAGRILKQDAVLGRDPPLRRRQTVQRRSRFSNPVSWVVTTPRNQSAIPCRSRAARHSSGIQEVSTAMSHPRRRQRSSRARAPGFSSSFPA